MDFDVFRWYANRVGPVQRERWQSAELLEFRAAQPCAVPGCSHPSEVHHLVMGRKNISSDILTLGLCARHHEEIEDISTGRFEEKYGINVLYLCICGLEQFLQAHELATRIKVDHKRVSHGTAKSKRKQLRRATTPLSKTCNVRLA